MRIRLPMMIQDPSVSQIRVGQPLVEDWTMLDEDHYLDGPVSSRVAIVDLDPNTDALEPGPAYLPPMGNRTFGHYDVAKNDIASPHFIPVSVFATVFRTIYLFEAPKVLGRKIRWAFDAPQLLVVPRAGWLANAYYERRSHSLQFFSFMAGDQVIHTGLSRDIVAHETAHALIDGIDPDLYDALDPQSLGMHEGIADLTAMLLAFSSGNLTKAILDQTDGSITTSTNFSSIAEEFGRAIDPSGKAGWLRNLLNDAKLPPDPNEEPEAHELSQVISGVLYGLMCELHEHFKRDLAARLDISDFSASGRALAVAAGLFGRMVLRGLDYLPPGEVTFADFGRAILAADQASYDDDTWRRWLRRNFMKRGIVRRESDLDVTTNIANEAVANVDLQGLVDSPWVAYTFAEANRELLGIPAGAQFEVLERLVVDGRFETPEATMDKVASKGRAPAPPQQPVPTPGPTPTPTPTPAPGPTTTPTPTPTPADRGGAAGGGAADEAEVHADGVPFRELLFKVRWSHVEPNPPDLGAAHRRVQTGTTLVIDWHAKRVRSLLRPMSFEQRRSSRDRMLRRMVEDGFVVMTEPDQRATKGSAMIGIDAVVTDGILRVSNTARLLHIVKDLDE